jgi:hypothetical protein
VIDGVFTTAEHEQVHFAQAGALTPEDLTAVQQQVRAQVLRWFAPSAGATHLSSRCKWQPSGLEFHLLNVAKWPLWKAFHNGHHGKMLFMESGVSASARGRWQSSQRWCP